jgi:hypothetical protein
VVVSQLDLELLLALFALTRPLGVVLLHDLAGLDDALNFVDDVGADAH